MSLFWVQIHNLPFSLLSLDVAISIGENLGEVQQMDNQSKMIGGNFLKVRAVIGISQPLCQGRKISFEDDSEGWISFKYNVLIFVTSVGGLSMMIRIVFSS